MNRETQYMHRPQGRMGRCASALRMLLSLVAIAAIAAVLLGDPWHWIDFMDESAPADELLIHGVQQHEPAAIDRALSRGAKVDARDHLHCTPLMWAAQAGDDQVVRKFLDL